MIAKLKLQAELQVIHKFDKKNILFYLEMRCPSDVSINFWLSRGSYYSAQFHYEYISTRMNVCLYCVGSLIGTPGILEQIKQRLLLLGSVTIFSFSKQFYTSSAS